MNVLIVGGSGYIGSMLQRWLWVNGHWIKNYDLAQGNDLRDMELFQRTCKGAHAVIWLAAISNNDDYMRRRALGNEVNKLPFPAVAHLSRCLGVRRFIYASSVAAYGCSKRPLPETTPLRPTTLYGDAKKYCEEALLSTTHPDMALTIVRSASVCGWSPSPRWDVTINKMIHDAKTKGEVKVNGGKQTRCHVNIKDLCRAYSMILDEPEDRMHKQIFNIVGWNETVLDSAKQVAKAFNAKLTIGPRTDSRSYAVSGKKAEKVLGFKPYFGMKDVLRDFV